MGQRRRDVPVTGEAVAILSEKEAPVRPNGGRSTGKKFPPIPVLAYADLKQIETPMEQRLFDGYPLPAVGATLIVGAPKTGKTLLAAQQALAVARGKHLFDYYSVLQPGPVMIVEQDDPGGAASIRDIVERSGGGPDDLALYVVPRLPFGFGPALLEWLEQQITARTLRLVVLDSYTALRGPRGPGIDIVKVEQTELTQLDALAKRLCCAVAIIHHGSKGAAALDWTQSAAGSYAMAAATDAQIHISRFSELEGAAERLIRIRGRRAADVYLVLRFRKETLDYEFVLENAAAALYPLMRQIKVEFDTEAFGAKDLVKVTGVSPATAYRQIERLRHANAVQKVGRGEYVLAVKV
jgi:hypothetical protein